MNVSACNQIKGKVVKIKKGEIHCLVTLEMPCGQTVCATVATDAAESLGVAEGKEMIALIKSTQVMLAAE